MDDPAGAHRDEAHVPWETLDGPASAECRVLSAEPGKHVHSEPTTPRSERAPAPSPTGVPGKAEKRCRTENSALSTQHSALTASPRDSGWSFPLLCAGIALIACCALIPQADANRRLAYEKRMLQLQLETVQKQIAVNGEFLKKVGQDPTLAQRLAERQMKVIPEGSRILELKHNDQPGSMSPFQLVNIAPPPTLPQYKPVGGFLARICYEPHSRLYLMGIALAMIATGLVLGAGNEV